MDNKKLKRKILNHERFRQLEERADLNRRKLDNVVNRARKRRTELFEDIAQFIKNFLEGKTFKGKKIRLDSDKPRTVWEAPDWWVYSFKLETGNMLGVVLAENTDNGPNLHAIFCNLDNEKVFYNDQELV